MPRYAVATYAGQIQRVISGGARYIEVPDDIELSDETHYIDTATNVAVERLALSPIVTIEGLVVTIDMLPESLTVTTNGMQTTTDNEPLVITYDVPGSYEIRLGGRVEYLDETLEVTIGNA